MIGRTLSHYRILEFLDAGGMGEVYRARDERLQRDVAIKLLPGGLIGDDDARRRILREARILSQLSHPHIAAVHDYGTADGTDFLVMELIEGETLAQRLARGPLSEAEIFRFGIEIAHGLAAAHERGVLHRDLKPSNLRVTPQGDLKILDFGLAQLARSSDHSATETVSAAGGLAGTLPYVAPERVLGNPGDARSDLYALGVVLYQMATGRRPFEDRGPAALAHDIAYATPAPPRAVRPELSEGLERIIRKSMEKEPTQRYQTAGDLSADLERGAAAVPTAEGAGKRLPRPVAVLAAAGGALALVMLLGVLFNVGGIRGRLSGTGGLKSLAVLPLANLSKDPAQEYFSDGMTVELIGSLAQVASLRVISSASSMALKGTTDPPNRIAKRLGVTHIVQGSVLRMGDHIKFSAELIGIRPERVLWASSYEGTAGDAINLQGQLAQAIVQEIQARLTPQERDRLAHPREVDPAAHEAYLRGLYYYTKRDRSLVQKAMEYFQEAVRIDPTYAMGWAGVAHGYYGFSNLYLPPREAMPLVRAAAERAVTLDPGLSAGHTFLGVVHSLFDWDWAAADRDFKRAIALDPSSPFAHMFRAQLFLNTGRFALAREEYGQAERMDPLSPDWGGSLAWCDYFSGAYGAAIHRFQRLIEMDPKNADQRSWLGLCYFRRGDVGPALVELRLGAELADHPWPRAQLAYVLASTGSRAEAESILRELVDPPAGENRSNYSIALVTYALGNPDESFQWLEKGFESRDEDMPFIHIDPAWAPLRSDPRFQNLLQRMGFTDYD